MPTDPRMVKSRRSTVLLWLGSISAITLPLAAVPADDPLQVPHGQLTFDSEGTEGSPYHSRKPSVPTATSGLTIGRGYDMKEKSAAKIIRDLEKAGLDSAAAKLYGGAAGLSGEKAKAYIAGHALPEITKEQQKALFAISYAEAEEDVRRICDKDDVVKKYGKTDWSKLHSAIKDVLVDLRFRGDYTSKSREHIQKLVSHNDLKGIATVMAERALWAGVPADRFNRRKEFIRKVAGE